MGLVKVYQLRDVHCPTKPGFDRQGTRVWNWLVKDSTLPSITVQLQYKESQNHEDSSQTKKTCCMKDFSKRAETASKFYKFRAQATNQWVPHIRWNRQIDKSQYSVKPTKAISFRRRVMWKTTALRMWNTTIDFMKSYMNPLESSCMLHRTGWFRNSKRTESTKLTKQTDSSAVALLVPISLAFFVVLLCFSFISNFDESFVSSSLAQKAWPFMQAIDLVYTIHKELQNHANVLQIYL